ncbi:MAG: tRNA (adenosine(37)-N6)-threonylcarbamoyltransferase complex ATPase subunit type 1 TsaE [Cyanobacteria bacterium J06627_8]
MTIENGSTITLSLSTLQETFQLGHLLGRSLPAGSIVLLQGELGSGKTTLVKAIGQGLSILDEIISPTFVLVNEYGSGRVPLYHFDLYRLNDSHIKTLIIEQYWDEAEYEPGIVVIEWANRLSDRPPHAMTISLSQIPSLSSLPERVESLPNASANSLLEQTDECRTAVVTLEGDYPEAMTTVWSQLSSLELSPTRER